MLFGKDNFHQRFKPFILTAEKFKDFRDHVKHLVQKETPYQQVLGMTQHI